MSDNTEYVLIDSTVLPEVFTKVLYAKKILARGSAASLSKAAEMAGISRSALYKYKDKVFPYMDISKDKIINIYAELLDKPGVLSELISGLYKCGVNILTINQSIPVDSIAPVSLSVRINTLNMPVQNMLKTLKNDNIIVIKIVA